MVKGYLLHMESQEELKKELKKIGCDEEGVSMMAPRGRFHLMKLTGVPLRAALILKQEMLSRRGEAALPWQASTLKLETCPVLLMGTERTFLELLQVLPHQPYGLPQVGEKMRELLTGEKRQRMETNRGTLPLDRGPLLMGILNYTPDSFYDGGRYDSRKKALQRAVEMEEEGAHIIDIGGESTRPGSMPLSPQEEMERILPVLEDVLKETKIPISVDTYKGEVAQAALQAGASIINDIRGLQFDATLPAAVAQYQAAVVIMHIQGEPRTMQQDPEYQDLLLEIASFLEEGAEMALKSGIPQEKIIMDPGIGFGKTVDDNLKIIRDLPFFHSLGYPLLVGVSRKSFIGKTLGLPLEERLEGTAAAVAISVKNGASILRVHDVKEMRRVVEMAHAVTRGYY